MCSSDLVLSKLAGVRHVALDMDGTIYRGDTLFSDTPPFLDRLDSLRLGYTFLTNNPSKSNRDYQAKLRQLGIHIKPDQLYTSTQATIEYLGENHPATRRLFVLGTPSLAEAFADAGFAVLADDPAQRPDAVIVGFDTALTYDRLCRAAWWIAQGVPYFCTNPDAVCPTDRPTVLVDCGSITAALEKATGRAPVAVLGKPDVAMLRGILRRHGLEAAQLLMVGDRLYTDIVMAQRAGACAALVLTGETTAEQAARCRPPPDLILSGLSELGAKLREAHGVFRTTDDRA
jgi:HAD superfamily hydrolase (TIGR01450 family)